MDVFRRLMDTHFPNPRTNAEVVYSRHGRINVADFVVILTTEQEMNFLEHLVGGHKVKVVETTRLLDFPVQPARSSSQAASSPEHPFSARMRTACIARQMSHCLRSGRFKGSNGCDCGLSKDDRNPVGCTRVPTPASSIWRQRLEASTAYFLACNAARIESLDIKDRIPSFTSSSSNSVSTSDSKGYRVEAAFKKSIAAVRSIGV